MWNDEEDRCDCFFCHAGSVCIECCACCQASGSSSIVCDGSMVCDYELRTYRTLMRGASCALWTEENPDKMWGFYLGWHLTYRCPLFLFLKTCHHVYHSIRKGAWRSGFRMIDIVSIILITVLLVSWGFIVNSHSLRKKWIYVLITFVMFWGIVELIDYLAPSSPHYE